MIFELNVFPMFHVSIRLARSNADNERSKKVWKTFSQSSHLPFESRVARSSKRGGILSFELISQLCPGPRIQKLPSYSPCVSKRFPQTSSEARGSSTRSRNRENWNFKRKKKWKINPNSGCQSSKEFWKQRKERRKKVFRNQEGEKWLDSEENRNL